MLLAIDIGNTRIKWGIFDASDIPIDTGAALHTDLINVTFPTASEVIIGNVADQSVLRMVIDKLDPNTKINQAKTTQTFRSLHNQYQNIEQLGIDRWLAAVAAWSLFESSCLIVNAGTAITVDAILLSKDKLEPSKAHYLGGWISPGLKTMQTSLTQSTSQLDFSNANQLFNTENSMISFGLNTHDAIKNGTMASAVGLVLSGLQSISTIGAESPKLIISGGDGKQIANVCNALGHHAIHDEHLVLKGLHAVQEQSFR